MIGSCAAPKLVTYVAPQCSFLSIKSKCQRGFVSGGVIPVQRGGVKAGQYRVAEIILAQGWTTGDVSTPETKCIGMADKDASVRPAVSPPAGGLTRLRDQDLAVIVND